MSDKQLPALTLGDAWRAAAGSDLAHLFPASGEPCLCGAHKRQDAAEPASALTHATSRAPHKVYRPYCPECLRLRLEQWGREPFHPPHVAAS